MRLPVIRSRVATAAASMVRTKLLACFQSNKGFYEFNCQSRSIIRNLVFIITLLSAEFYYSFSATVVANELSNIDISSVQPRPYKNLPPLPVYILTHGRVEPNRNVRASQWKSPYCTLWSDGKTLCKRNSFDKSHNLNNYSCNNINYPYDSHSSRREHEVACFKADLSILEKTCHVYILYDPGAPIPYLPNFRVGSRPGGGLVQMNWNWVDGAWQSSATHDDAAASGTKSDLIRKGLLRDDIPDIRTFFCILPYSNATNWREMTPGKID